MTRMTGPDCAVMCNLINTHTHTPATSCLSHLLRTVPPSITCQATANYDGLVEWALAFIINGDGAAAAGLSTPEEVAHDPTVCQNQTYLGHEALRQAHLPNREGGLGLTSSSSIKGAAYICCHALILGRVVAAFARGNIPSLLERLPERPMVSALIEELKTMATEAKRSQIEDAVGSSWVALAAEEGPQEEGAWELYLAFNQSSCAPSTHTVGRSSCKISKARKVRQ